MTSSNKLSYIFNSNGSILNIGKITYDEYDLLKNVSIIKNFNENNKNYKHKIDFNLSSKAIDKTCYSMYERISSLLNSRNTYFQNNFELFQVDLKPFMKFKSKKSLNDNEELKSKIEEIFGISVDEFYDNFIVNIINGLHINITNTVISNKIFDNLKKYIRNNNNNKISNLNKKKEIISDIFNEKTKSLNLKYEIQEIENKNIVYKFNSIITINNINLTDFNFHRNILKINRTNVCLNESLYAFNTIVTNKDSIYIFKDLKEQEINNTIFKLEYIMNIFHYISLFDELKDSLKYKLSFNIKYATIDKKDKLDKYNFCISLYYQENSIMDEFFNNKGIFDNTLEENKEFNKCSKITNLYNKIGHVDSDYNYCVIRNSNTVPSCIYKKEFERVFYLNRYNESSYLNNKHILNTKNKFTYKMLSNEYADSEFEKYNIKYVLDKKKIDVDKFKLFSNQKNNIVFLQEFQNRVLNNNNKLEFTNAKLLKTLQEYYNNFDINYIHKILYTANYNKKFNYHPFMKNNLDIKLIDTFININGENYHSLGCSYYNYVFNNRRQRNNQYYINVCSVKLLYNFTKLDYSGLSKEEINNFNNYKCYKSIKNNANIKKNNKLLETILTNTYKDKININGSILCDDVGLGKTLSTLTHIYHNLPSDRIQQNTPSDKKFDLNTLILLPTRLLKQWKFEIEKYFGKTVNVKLISSITDIKKIYTLIDKDKKKFEKDNKSFILDNLDNKLQQYDIFLMSINLLDNENYYEYLINGYISKSYQERKTYDIESYFDIFRIKWNRIIIDEIHENVMSLNNINKSDENMKLINKIKKAKYNSNNFYYNNLKNLFKTVSGKTKAICNNIIYNFNSNMYIGLSATPFELDNANINGYMALFTNEFKQTDITNMYDFIVLSITDTKHLINYISANSDERDLCNVVVNKSLKYKTITLDLLNKIIEKDYKKEKSLYGKLFRFYMNNFVMAHNKLHQLFSCEELKNFERMIIQKTSKISLRGELDIPIFTEEIETFDLSSIEKSIYDSAKSDISVQSARQGQNNAEVNLKRLFQLCTNFYISKKDVDNLGIDLSERVLSLEELNEAMIKNFSRQLKIAEADYDNYIKVEMPNIKKKNKLLENYMKSLNKNHIKRLEKRWDSRNIKNFINRTNVRGASYEVVYYIPTTDEIIDQFRWVRKDFNLELATLTDYTKISQVFDEKIELYQFIHEYFNKHIKPNNYNYLVYELCRREFNNCKNRDRNHEDDKKYYESEIKRLKNQIKMFESNELLKEKTDEPCIICWDDFDAESMIAITKCRHIMCANCFEIMIKQSNPFDCPECRSAVTNKTVNIISYEDILNEGKKKEQPEQQEEQQQTQDKLDNNPNAWKDECLNKYGTKMMLLISRLKDLFQESRKEENNRVIIFSQYDDMLRLIASTLNEFNIKNLTVKENVHSINKSIDTFKRDDTYRVIMLSGERANSGCNLTEANHIIFVDVLNMNAERTKDVETQAIGRAVRLGQQRPVKVIRMISKNTIESEYYEKNKYDISLLQ